MLKEGVINKYFDYLPVDENISIVSLSEGDTPLIEAKNIQRFIKADFKLFLKYEGANPTGSFKDRGMTVAISKVLQRGTLRVICASTGNTAASAAAYAAKARMDCIIVIPQGQVARGKLAQIVIYNPQIIQIKGNFDAALDLVRYISEHYPIALVNSLNPDRIEGQKTAAFEVCDVLKESPQYHVLPVGNAGNITAYWKGYKDYKKFGKINDLPKMVGIQASGAAPIIEGKKIDNPQTIATAIKIGNPASWQYALQAKEESQGIFFKVEDREIIDAVKLLAEYEGLFVEPASAAGIAGLIKLNKEGYFQREKKKNGSKNVVVVTLTGFGLKDIDFVEKYTRPSIKVCEPTEDSLVSAISLNKKEDVLCRR